MHNSCTEHLPDGPRAKGKVCKFQNLERRSKKKNRKKKTELQYVCTTNAQCNHTLARGIGSGYMIKMKTVPIYSKNPLTL